MNKRFQKFKKTIKEGAFFFLLVFFSLFSVSALSSRSAEVSSEDLIEERLRKKGISLNVVGEEPPDFKAPLPQVPIELSDRGSEDIKKRYKRSWSYLHWAARDGDIYNIEFYVLKREYDVNVQDKEGQTPLMLATIYGHKEAVELLIDMEAEIKIRDKHNKTAFVYAIENGEEEIAKLLLRGKPPAAYFLSLLPNIFTSNKANVNVELDQDYTVLMKMAKKGDTEMLIFLLEHGARINQWDRNGKTPLMYAVEMGHELTVEALIIRGADVNAQDHLGRIALVYASKLGNIDMAKLLLANHSYLISRDADGLTPLDYAIIKGNLEMENFLNSYQLGEVDISYKTLEKQ